MAVVKADGDNHGSAAVAGPALESCATHVGVATVGEALELRRAGVTAPILCWLHGPPAADRQGAAGETVPQAARAPRSRVKRIRAEPPRT